MHSVSPYPSGTCLRGGPLIDEASGETAAQSVQDPEGVTFRRHQGGVDVQAVTHGIVASCMNMVEIASEVPYRINSNPCSDSIKINAAEA